MKNNVNYILKNIKINEEVTEEELLQKMSSGITILEYTLRRRKIPNCFEYSNTKSIDIILDTKRYDLLQFINLNTLLKKNNKNNKERYIETIIKLKEYDKNVNISFYNPFVVSDSLYDIATLYIIYAKYNVLDYLPQITKEMLLFRTQNNISFLDILINLDKDLSLNKIISPSVQSEFEIAIKLKENNINVNKVKIEVKPNNFIQSRIDKLNEEYDNIKLTKEEDYLLKTLYMSFIGNSDKKAVETLINSFKLQLFNKNTNAINEIIALINIKKNDKSFCLKLGNESYFSPNLNELMIEKNMVEIINHELGHMFFHKLTDEQVPNDFWNILSRIRNNKDTLRKVNEYSIHEHESVNRISKYTSELYDKTFPMMNKIIELFKIENSLNKIYDYELDEKRKQLLEETKTTRKEIEDFLSKSKSEKIKLYKSLGYDDDTLNILFKDVFTIKEYVMMHRRIQKRELRNSLTSAIINDTHAIGDIIDAVYEGEFLGGKLYYNNEKIKPICGHGLYYYNVDKRNIFDEIIANYRTIISSKRKEKNIKLLRYYIGDELVDYLDNFYNNMLKINNKLNINNIEEKGKRR